MLVRALVALGPSPRADALSSLLGQLGSIVRRVTGLREARSALQDDEGDVLLIDAALLGSHPAARVTDLRARSEHLHVVVIGSLSPIEQARLVAAGCKAVLDPSVSDTILRESVTTLVESRRRDLVRRLRAEQGPIRSSVSDFATASPAMQALVGTVRRIVDSSSSLLVLGETGVGKEWLSRAIHLESPRGGGPFIAVNCGALPDSLLESELFGHERGSFTGAVRSRRGYFEIAHGGTLFLDEIAEMPTHLQVKLLRVLEDRSVRPIGSESLVDIDVRIIAATNRDPMAEVLAGRLRRDLYYRLGVVTLTVPPLRERKEDIGLLAESNLQRITQRIGRDVVRFEPSAMHALVQYAWPGNVRELINVVERAVLLSTGPEIRLEDLPEGIQHPHATLPGVDDFRPSRPGAVFETSSSDGELPPLAVGRRIALERFERAYLTEVLRRSGVRVGEAADRAGIDERTLYEKMQRLGLRKEDFRHPTRRGRRARAGT